MPEAEQLLASLDSKTEKLAGLLAINRVSDETTEVMHYVMHHVMHYVMHYAMHHVMHDVMHYVMHYVMRLGGDRARCAAPRFSSRATSKALAQHGSSRPWLQPLVRVAAASSTCDGSLSSVRGCSL